MTFYGGLVLSGPRGFGGWSGLLVDGERLLAVSDVGRWLTGTIVEEDGHPAAIEDAAWFVRRDTGGSPIRDKARGDAEALARVDGGVLVANESTQEVLFYPTDGIAVDFDAPAQRLEVDPRMVAAARRFGFEALATMPDGGLVAIMEHPPRGGHRIEAFRRPGGRFTVRQDGDWSVTGADALPGGDLIIVERRYGGGMDVGMRVRRIGADAVREATGVVDGPVLIEATFASEIDNIEAVSASVAGGQIVLTLMSDDNLRFLQRTLLLRFTVRDRLPRPKPPSPTSPRASADQRPAVTAR